MYTKEQLGKVAKALGLYIQEYDGIFTFDRNPYSSLDAVFLSPEGSRAIQDYLIAEGFNVFSYSGDQYTKNLNDWIVDIGRLSVYEMPSKAYNGKGNTPQEALLNCMIQYVEVKNV